MATARSAFASRAKPKKMSAFAVGISHGFRSGLEADTSKFLADHGVLYRYEAVKIPYTKPASEHTYTPDFTLPSGIIVETKGIWDVDDRRKHLLVKEQHPTLDIRIVFSNARAKINPGSKTTYAEWCDKHGIVWAHRTIPIEWLSEPGPNPETLPAFLKAIL